MTHIWTRFRIHQSQPTHTPSMFRGFLRFRDIVLISFALSRKNAEVFRNYNVSCVQINSREVKYRGYGSARMKNHRFLAIFRECFEVFTYFEILSWFQLHLKDLVPYFEKNISIIGRTPLYENLVLYRKSPKTSKSRVCIRSANSNLNCVHIREW